MRIRVWDLPTRLFHWFLALCVAALVATGKSGGDWMRWHFLLGQAVLALLVFRILWGCVGGYWSRFARFYPNPLAAWRYLKSPSRQPGHNPLGAFSVWGLLALLSLQGLSGLFSDDEIASTGPLSHTVSGMWVERATSWHTSWGLNVLLALVALHVHAIFFYQRVKKQALLPAMLHGDQDHELAHPASEDTRRTRSLALFLFLLSVAAVTALIWRYGN